MARGGRGRGRGGGNSPLRVTRASTVRANVEVLSSSSSDGDMRKKKKKKAVVVEGSRKSFSTRCAPNRLSKCFMHMDDAKTGLLAEYNVDVFASSQLRQICSRVVDELLKHYDFVRNNIILPSGEELRLTEDAVRSVYGLPSGGIEVDIEAVNIEDAMELAKGLQIDEYVNSDEIGLTELEGRLQSVSVGDTESWLRLTLLMMIAAVFMPHNHFQADIRLLPFISGGSAHFKKFNWCKFILDQLFDAMDKYSRGIGKYILGDVQFLMVIFLKNVFPTNPSGDVPYLCLYTDSLIRSLGKGLGSLYADKGKSKRVAFAKGSTNPVSAAAREIRSKQVADNASISRPLKRMSSPSATQSAPKRPKLPEVSLDLSLIATLGAATKKKDEIMNSIEECLQMLTTRHLQLRQIDSHIKRLGKLEMGRILAEGLEPNSNDEEDDDNSGERSDHSEGEGGGSGGHAAGDEVDNNIKNNDDGVVPAETSMNVDATEKAATEEADKITNPVDERDSNSVKPVDATEEAALEGADKFTNPADDRVATEEAPVNIVREEVEIQIERDDNLVDGTTRSDQSPISPDAANASHSPIFDQSPITGDLQQILKTPTEPVDMAGLLGSINEDYGLDTDPVTVPAKEAILNSAAGPIFDSTSSSHTIPRTKGSVGRVIPVFDTAGTSEAIRTGKDALHVSPEHVSQESREIVPFVSRNGEQLESSFGIIIVAAESGDSSDSHSTMFGAASVLAGLSSSSSRQQPIRAQPINVIHAADVHVIDKSEDHVPSETEVKFAIEAYAWDSNLDPEELLFQAIGCDVQVSRQSTLTLTCRQEINVDILNVYIFHQNRRNFVGGRVKRWIFPANFSWFVPVLMNEHYIVYVINNIDKKIDFCDPHSPDNYEEVHRALSESITYLLDCFSNHHQFRRRNKPLGIRTYSLRVQKRLKAHNVLNTGLYVLQMCQGWEGKYRPHMSTTWNNAEVVEKFRKDILHDIVLNDLNVCKNHVVSRALKSFFYFQ
ncbi:hypothetical protein LINGRAHAP2_LOCUS2083 [Linum grandiflorum]